MAAAFRHAQAKASQEDANEQPSPDPQQEEPQTHYRKRQPPPIKARNRYGNKDPAVGTVAPTDIQTHESELEDVSMLHLW